MKFTSEDLLNVMGLEVGNRILVGENIFNIYVVENCCSKQLLKE